MGVCTMLVSDKSKMWFDLGKVFFDKAVVESMKKDDGAIEQVIFIALQDVSFNVSSTPEIAARDAGIIAAWMRAHPDWRFLTDVDGDFDDVYFAEDEEDAADYVEELGDQVLIYMKDRVDWDES